MKTIRLTLLVGAVLAAALNSCRKDVSPVPVASELRDSSAMGPLALRHFKCKDPKKTLSEGLLAYYPFSGNADDWSGHGFNGEVSGALLTMGKSGCNNSAYSFNGTSDYIKLPFSFGDTARFSVYARLKRGSNGTIFSMGEMYRGLQSNLAVSSDSTSITVTLYWTDLIHYVIVPEPPRRVGYATVSLPLALQDRWEDISVTFDYPAIKMYINGKMLASWTHTGLWLPIWGPYAIGGSTLFYVPSRNSLTGVIDEMRFYTRPLSEKEIDYLYKH